MGLRLGNPSDLRTHLKSILPKGLMPGNVGRLNSVVWPFWYMIRAQLGVQQVGANWQYVISPNLTDTQFFQVDAEAAYLMVSLSLSAGPTGANWRNEPITLEIQDRQSTRNFMNSPMPINQLGEMSNALILERPFYVQPRGSLSFRFGAITSSATPVTRIISTTALTTAAPQLVIEAFGYRLRAEDADAILSPVYGDETQANDPGI